MQCKGVYIATLLLAFVAVSASRPKHGSGGHCTCHGPKCTCNDDCICPYVHDPVCGTNGKTYGNSCEAACDGVKVDCEQECPCPKCEDHCREIYKPVCGKDGKQYDNECLAKCAGTSVDCHGHCPCKPTCVKEGGTCLNKNSVGNVHLPRQCCGGLECCSKHSIGKHNSISGVCQHRCDPYKG